MSELEDLNAKAARLWLEFFQAQAKAAANAAKNLPEVTRSVADAAVPLAAEVKRWMEGALPRTSEPAEAPAENATSLKEGMMPIAQSESAAAQEAVTRPLTRSKHRRVKTMQRSLSRRRARRA